jgi:uncharacterized protein
MAATKIGQMAQELARTNPWWRGPGWEPTDPDLRAASASGLAYSADSLDDLVEGSLYLLRGPRRVGKTVSVKQTISAVLAAGTPPLTVVRVAADGWTANELRTVVQNAALPPVPPGRRRWWFIDEVTAVRGDWATQIEWLRDNDPDFASATVILTGSSASSLTAAAGVLAGRRGQADRTDRTLLPMGMRTFAELLQPPIGSLPRLAITDLHTATGKTAYQQALPWLDDLVKLWELYLRYGGFPASVAAAHAGKEIPGWFVNDLFSVIHRDAFTASHLSEPQTTALVSRIWQSTSTPANLSSVAQDVGVTQDVVTRHVGYLRDAYLLWTCPQKADSGWQAREKAQDKIYAIDPLIARLGHLRNSNREDLDVTKLAETQVGLGLRRAILASSRAWGDDDRLFYHRTATRKEIDFVGEALADAAVEGKYTEGGGWRGAAATVSASNWRGLLTTRNVLDCGDLDDAWAVPAAMFAALVDT